MAKNTNMDASKMFNSLMKRTADVSEVKTSSTSNSDINKKTENTENSNEAKNDIKPLKKKFAQGFDTNTIHHTKKYDIFHPYPKAELRLELHEGVQREQLKNSIEAHGITSPIKVAPMKALDYTVDADENIYVVLSGHNRLSIAKELGIEIPYIIFDNISEDTKDEIVAEEHILNRQQSDLKPSQMMKLLIAIRKTSNNQKELLEKTALSKASTYRYLSLEKLLPELLYEWVDTQRLSLMSADPLSRIDIDKQKSFYEYIQNKGFRIIQEKPMKRLISSRDNSWDECFLNDIFLNEKKKNNLSLKFDIPVDVLNRSLTDSEKNHIQEMVLEYIKTLK